MKLKNRIISVICAVSVLVCALCLPAYAAPQSYIYLEHVSSNENELVVDLCVFDGAELGIKSFGVYLTYSSNVSLTECVFNKEVGTPTFYDIMDEPTDEPFIFPGLPCRILWTSSNDRVGGGKTVLGSFTFISSDAPISESDVKLSLAIDFDNMIKDADGNVIDKSVTVAGMEIVGGVIPPSPVVMPVAGDANDDGKVSLVDVALILQYIANWEVGLDLYNADVTGDDQVSLTDASLILKYIAKWDVEFK